VTTNELEEAAGNLLLHEDVYKTAHELHEFVESLKIIFERTENIAAVCYLLGVQEGKRQKENNVTND